MNSDAPISYKRESCTSNVQPYREKCYPCASVTPYTSFRYCTCIKATHESWYLFVLPFITCDDPRNQTSVRNRIKRSCGVIEV